MAEFDPLSPATGLPFSRHGSIYNSSTTTTVPGIDLNQLLDRTQRLEVRLQKQATLLLEQTANCRLMEECMTLMKENMDERLEELEKRIDRIEAGARTRTRTQYSSCSCRAPPSLTSTRSPTRAKTATQQQLHPNTSGSRAIPPGIPGLARRTTLTAEPHQSILQGILSRTTTINSSNTNNQNERIDTIDWGQVNIQLGSEMAESLLPVTRANIINMDINPLQRTFCPPSSTNSNLILQDAGGLANHYASSHSIPGVCQKLPSAIDNVDKPRNGDMIHLPQGGQLRVQSQARSCQSRGIQSSKNGNRRRPCPKCGKYVSGFYQHLLTHKSPSERRRFICPTCGAEFLAKRNLQNHHQTKHSDEPFERPLPTLPCQICGKLFHQKHGLKAHMTAHSSERPFPCKYCGKTFSRKTVLRAHLLIHTGKPYTCDQCGLQFTARVRFASHKLRCQEKKTTARPPPPPGGSRVPIARSHPENPDVLVPEEPLDHPMYPHQSQNEH